MSAKALFFSVYSSLIGQVEIEDYWGLNLFPLLLSNHQGIVLPATIGSVEMSGQSTDCLLHPHNFLHCPPQNPRSLCSQTDRDSRRNEESHHSSLPQQSNIPSKASISKEKLCLEKGTNEWMIILALHGQLFRLTLSTLNSLSISLTDEESNWPEKVSDVWCC